MTIPKLIETKKDRNREILESASQRAMERERRRIGRLVSSYRIEWSSAANP